MKSTYFVSLLLLALLPGMSPLWGQEPKEVPVNRDLESFIQSVAKETGKTILYDESVLGRKFFLSKSKATSPEALFKIFQAAIEFQGFILETTGEKDWEVIKVKRNIVGPWTATPVVSWKELESIQHENVFVTAIIPLQHASCKEVQTTLRAMRIVNPQAGSLVGLESTDTLLISDFAPNIKRIYEVIALLDRPKDKDLTPIELSGLSINGQTIPIFLPSGADVLLTIRLRRNAGFTITNNDGQVLSHLDSDTVTTLWLTPWIIKQPATQFHLTMQARKTGESAIEIVVETKDAHRQLRQLWSFSLERLVAAGQKVTWSLLFQPSALTEATPTIRTTSENSVTKAVTESAKSPETANEDTTEVRRVKEILERKASMDFSEAPLSDIIDFLRQQTGLNIIIHPQVYQDFPDPNALKLDVSVNDLKIVSLLNIIMDMKGLSYHIKSDGVLMITTKQK